MNNLTDAGNEKIKSPDSDQTGASKDLKLIEKIIDRGSQMLEDESYFPRIQDILKAIQLREKVNKMVKEEDSKSFWEMIERARQEELPKMYPDENSLESLIKAAIYSLRFEVTNGIVSVKAITDAYNLGRSEETRLTYTRMGRLLTRMGFVKAKTSNGCSAIFWNDSLLSPKVHLLDEKNENLTPEAPEPPDAPEPPVE
jgi:hypothetical protein